MARKKTKKSTNSKNPEGGVSPSKFILFFKSEQTRFIFGLLFSFLSVYMGLALISFLFTGGKDQSEIENLPLIDLLTNQGSVHNWAGIRGAYLANALINSTFGLASFFLLYLLFSIGFKLMRVNNIRIWKRLLLTLCAILWGSVFFGFFLQPFFNESFISPGGKHGYYISQFLINNIGYPGTILLLLSSLIIILVATSAKTIPFFRALFSLSFLKRRNRPKHSEDEYSPSSTGTINQANAVQEEKKSPEIDLVPSVTNSYSNNEHDITTAPQDDIEIVSTPTEEEPYQVKDQELDVSVAEEEETVDHLPTDNYDPRLDLSSYRFPTLELLKKYDQSDKVIDMEEQNSNKNRIIQTLETFGIKIASIKATVGPTITLYEIVPEAGVRITKIRNLEDDIALSLSALGIRIIAPMPGKGTIGIEVPNKDPQIVSMQSIIASKRFQESSYDLPIAFGKTITNEIFMVDLCKMPHLLVAGATGQGKSVGLNAIITSLLYKKHPAELKFVLVDPKMVEFNIYSAIERHYLAMLPDAEKAIITDFSKVVQTLNSLTKEMDDRYDLLMKANTRNIKEYNEKFITRRLNPEKGHKYMPYIVVVIDEFGDLIMTAGKEIELPIARIAQKARAVGMHMIIATQRPSANIITGTIKANFPARIAFRVSSMIDSRTILDANGANQLIGRGDLLFSQGNDMIRVQCAFVDTPEVERIAEYIGAQRGYSTAFLLPEYVGEESGDKMPGAVDLSDRDPLFDEAARLLVIHQQGSTSLIQRKFSIGYNRAGRLMDQLEAAGIVGPFEGSKARQILVQDEYQLEQLLNSLKTP